MNSSDLAKLHNFKKRVEKARRQKFYRKKIKINSPYLAFFSALHYLSQSLRLPVSTGNNEIMLQGGLAVCPPNSSHSVTDHPTTTGEVSVQTEEKQNDPQILLPQCLCSLKLSTEIDKNNPQSALQCF